MTTIRSLPFPFNWELFKVEDYCVFICLSLVWEQFLENDHQEVLYCVVSCWPQTKRLRWGGKWRCLWVLGRWLMSSWAYRCWAAGIQGTPSEQRLEYLLLSVMDVDILVQLGVGGV